MVGIISISRLVLELSGNPPRLGTGRLRQSVRQRFAYSHLGWYASPRRYRSSDGVAFSRDTGQDLVLPAWVVVIVAGMTGRRIPTRLHLVALDLVLGVVKRHGDSAALMESAGKGFGIAECHLLYECWAVDTWLVDKAPTCLSVMLRELEVVACKKGREPKRRNQ